MKHVIGSFDGDHFFLSNFAPSPIRINPAHYPDGAGFDFRTGEHAFQAAKYKAMTGSDREKVAYINSLVEASTPNEAKRLGRGVKIDLDKWEDVKILCMREVVFEKFRQNEDLRKSLLATGHALLVEGNTWGDKFWGRCEGKGYNVLGAILMEVRGFWHWSDSRNFSTPSSCSYPCVTC